MASLPPRKRPWHDGPGTGDMDAPIAIPDERGAGKISSEINNQRMLPCKTV